MAKILKFPTPERIHQAEYARINREIIRRIKKSQHRKGYWLGLLCGLFVSAMIFLALQEHPQQAQAVYYRQPDKQADDCFASQAYRTHQRGE